MRARHFNPVDRLRRQARRVRRYAGAAGLLVGLVAFGMGVAHAYWGYTDSSNAHTAKAAADSLPAGNQPSLVSINGEDVTISWTADTTVTGGQPVAGYTINRYRTPIGGTATAATGGCSGTVFAVACTEQNVTPGSWYYAITPVLDDWTGAEGSRSTVIPVVAPTMGILINSTTPTATVVNTDPVNGGTHTVTNTCTTIQSSMTDSCRVDFSVRNNDSMSITVTVVSNGGSPTFASPWSDNFTNPGPQVLAPGASFDYTGGIAWSTLSNADLGSTHSVTYSITATA